jgi:hypothetical protein
VPDLGDDLAFASPMSPIATALLMVNPVRFASSFAPQRPVELFISLSRLTC